MVVFLAGLQTIPGTLYEAASIDGAGRWAAFRHVTLPLLRPTTLFIVVITTIGYLQLFEEPFVMTDGGPLDRTLSISMYMYRAGLHSSSTRATRPRSRGSCSCSSRSSRSSSSASCGRRRDGCAAMTASQPSRPSSALPSPPPTGADAATGRSARPDRALRDPHPRPRAHGRARSSGCSWARSSRRPSSCACRRPGSPSSRPSTTTSACVERLDFPRFFFNSIVVAVVGHGRAT